MLENYVNYISFGMTTLVLVFIEAMFFISGMKLFKSGKKSRVKGFVWFIAGPIVIALTAPFFNQLVLGFLEKNISNLVWILIGFLLAAWLYYSKEYK